MKKLFRTAIILALMLFVSLALFSCGKELSGVTFENSTLTYTGAEQTVEVKGAPEGATVTYSPSNKFTEAGTYEITATVKAEGYDDKVLKATVIVAPKTLNVTWINKGPFGNIGKAPTFKYALEGVAEGDEVTLAFDFGEYDFKKAGTKPVTVTATNKNYTLKAEDATFDVKFAAINCTVSFETGVDTELSDETVRAGRKVDTPRTLNNLGYTFDGWYYGDKKWDFDNDIVEGDMTLTAKWIPIEYNINYYLNGGVNSPNNPQTFTVETEKQLEMPTKAGYAFLGWFKDKDLTQPADKLGGIRQGINLYAKWSENKLTDSIVADKINASVTEIVGPKTAVNGEFTYVFTANVTNFADDGAIYIGRGFETVDGSYIEITSNQIIAYTNGTVNQIISNPRGHIRSFLGYMTVEIKVGAGNATVTLHTADGESSTSALEWSGRNGEIFFSAEDVELTDATLGWYIPSYENGVWILGEEATGFGKTGSWVTKIYDSIYANYRDFVLIGANGLDSTAIVNEFKTEIEKSAPKFAIWSFTKESGAAYDTAMAEFISVCEANGVTPILTTHPTEFCADNAAKNEVVKASGKRYIDFALVAETQYAINLGEYTITGGDMLYNRLMIDFPEIICPDAPVRTDRKETINSVDSSAVESGDATVDEITETGVLLNGNTIKDGKTLIFNAKIDGELEEGQYIKVGHGYYQSTATWLEINSSTYDVCNYRSWTDPNKSTDSKEHKLNIKNFITVIVRLDRDDKGNHITIITDGGIYERGINWTGTAGDMFAIADGLTLTDATLHWVCEDYSKDIWVFGDSYLSLGDPARWPTYMYNQGYRDALMVGCSGMRSAQGLADFKDSLKYDKPEYVVWCMGMNDSDKNGVLNASYIECVGEVLDLCEEYGIVPIISTIPTCLAANHAQKNYQINNGLGVFEGHDYRIVDMARAVDGYADFEEATWYPDMLHTDNVHPKALGAKALYMQLLHDFPELMYGHSVEVSEESAETLTAGNKLTVKAPEKYEDNKVFTFTADFMNYTGSIIIGNGDRTVDGASWVEISSTHVTAYQRIAGRDVKTAEAANDLLMRDIVTVAIHVVGGNAEIKIQSTGEKNAIGNVIFTVEADWSAVGDAYAEASGMSFDNAEFKWYTA